MRYTDDIANRSFSSGQIAWRKEHAEWLRSTAVLYRRSGDTRSLMRTLARVGVMHRQLRAVARDIIGRGC